MAILTEFRLDLPGTPNLHTVIYLMVYSPWLDTHHGSAY